MNALHNNIGFIGAGNMATALISGLIKAGYDYSRIYASSPEKDHLRKLEEEFSVNVTEYNKEVFLASSTIVLAVKPNVVINVLEESSEIISENEDLIVSIVAGLEIKSIQAIIGPDKKIIRAMPNTPASLGMSASALTHNNLVDEKDKKEAEKIFSSVGITCWLEEKFFDLYTALIGSGPAYIFYLIEALQESAQKIELSDNLIKNLIIQMIKGSASLAERSEDSPSKLRERVTSPGGVTERALEILNERKVKQHLVEAILEGASRSKNLGKRENG